MPLFSHADRDCLEAISRVAFSNPFLPERIELERAALGDEFQELSATVWSRQANVEELQPNVPRLAARASAIIDPARDRLVSGERCSTADLKLYEDVAIYVLYDRFRPQFQELIRQFAAGDIPAKISCWTEFRRQFDLYLRLPELQLPNNYNAAHIFAGLFQIRRAFHHIFASIVGQSLPTARLRAAVWQSIFTHDLRRYRRSLYARMNDISTLICGPTGTGKELVARAVGLSRYIPFHDSKQAFVDDVLGSFQSVNLSALAPTLIESDLFGHVKGAFTGATADRQGWLERCTPHGTVFLDEIGELDPAIQVKLLRVVQTRSFTRLGETESRRFEGKIIAATNRDLTEEIERGSFREDLYYRLCSDLIATVSLCEQLADSPDDLYILVSFAAERLVGDEAEPLAREVHAWIEANLGRNYAWPGNIRELEQCVRNCLVRGRYIPRRPPGTSVDSARTWLAEAERGALTADDLLTQYCRWVYRQVGTYEGTAERIGMDRRTVKRRVDAG